MRCISLGGCGFFPYSYAATVGGEGSQPSEYPLERTLDQLMRLFWRVKDWHLVITVASVPPVTYDLIIPNHYSYDSGNPAAAYSITRELDMLLSLDEPDLSINGAGFLYYATGAGADFLRANLYIVRKTLYLLTAQDRVRREPLTGPPNSALWFPHFGFFCQASSGEGTTIVFDTWGGSVTPPFPAYTINFTFDGIPMIVTGYSSNGNVTATLVPNSYWPFEKRSGGEPIWNGTTGTQILDPYKYDAIS